MAPRNPAPRRVTPGGRAGGPRGSAPPRGESAASFSRFSFSPPGPAYQSRVRTGDARASAGSPPAPPAVNHLNYLNLSLLLFDVCNYLKCVEII